MNEDKGIERVGGESGSGGATRSVAWFLAAFGFLFAGVILGTVLFAARPDFRWVAPVAGFVAYLLAFRRGMLLRNSRIDQVWRRDSLPDRAPAAPRSAWDPEATVRPLQQGAGRADHSPLRVVR